MRGRYMDSRMFHRIALIIAVVIIVPIVAVYSVFAMNRQSMLDEKRREQAYGLARNAAQEIGKEFTRFSTLSTEMAQLTWIKKICSNYPLFYEEYLNSPFEQEEIRAQFSLLNASFSLQPRMGFYISNKNMIISNRTIGDAALYFSGELSVAEKEAVFEAIKAADHCKLMSMDVICGAQKGMLLLCAPIPISTANQPILFQIIKTFYLDDYIQKMSIAALTEVQIRSMGGELLYAYGPEGTSKPEVYSVEYISPSCGLRFDVRIAYEGTVWFGWVMELLGALLILALPGVGAALILARIFYAPICEMSARLNGAI